MHKKQHVGIVEVICMINLLLLALMLVLTSYGPWFTEQRAVIISLLWFFSLAPAIAAAVYGIVDVNRHPKSKRHHKKLRLAISWTVIFVNGVAVLDMFLR